jgi:hypothetical protein
MGPTTSSARTVYCALCYTVHSTPSHALHYTTDSVARAPEIGIPQIQNRLQTHMIKTHNFDNFATTKTGAADASNMFLEP